MSASTNASPLTPSRLYLAEPFAHQAAQALGVEMAVRAERVDVDTVRDSRLAAFSRRRQNTRRQLPNHRTGLLARHVRAFQRHT
ncbi:hypothetical protein, partial [Streptomyces xylophagus]|uniref:hypothetical protein n=1 Tax=Streptomyces xylophagus TaxID=285514 RepID=UPI001F31BA78